jgi:hypothetical protein
MMLRVGAGALFIALNLLDWNAFVSSEVNAGTLDPSQQATASLVLGIAMGVFGAGLVLYFLLALLVFFGSNWARIAAMSYSSLIIVTAAIDSFNGGPEVSLRNNLLGVALDILVVIALSSKRSRLWARRARADASEAHSATRGVAHEAARPPARPAAR